MSNSLKLLVITGPTATGKSNLALALAKKFNGEIISADSRQIYMGMDIGTGKNLPKTAVKRTSKIKLNNKPLTAYDINGIFTWGYGLVSPLSDFSVADYLLFFNRVLQEIHSKGKLPILVGGTNFYIQSIINPPETLFVPQNKLLRKDLEQLSVVQLQKRLQESNPLKFSAMNNSDQHNPRRLIRAIEVALASEQNQIQPKLSKFDFKAIGLLPPKTVLEKNITKNVLQRATNSFTREVQKLDQIPGFWQSQAATATGYKIWNEYLKKNIDRETAILLWITEELQYAKRQLTWFKRQPLELIDTSKPDFQLHIEEDVSGW